MNLVSLTDPAGCQAVSGIIVLVMNGMLRLNDGFDQTSGDVQKCY